MPQGHVEYSFPTELLPLTSKSASFVSPKFAVNNNPNLSLSLHSMASFGLSGSARIQGSHDDAVWFDLRDTEASFVGNEDILWTLAELQSLMYVRVDVTLAAGSALFKIIARGT